MLIDWTKMKTAEQIAEGEHAATVPQEVPRWAGKLALKRHVLDADGLTLLAPDDDQPNRNLLFIVVTWRSTLDPGELADRVDAALDDAKDWVRGSDTVGTLAAVIGLTDKQIDELFVWAGQQNV